MVVKARIATFAGAALVAASAYAQDVDFSRIPGVDVEPMVQVNFGPSMLSFLTATAGASDPTVAEALGGLERVRVFVYSAVDNRDALARFVDDSAERLESQGWERTVIAEEGTSKVRVHTKVGDTRLEGITLMVLEGEKEAVFIDVAGDIDPATLGRAMAKLGVHAGLDQMVGAMSGLPGTVPSVPDAAVPAAAPRPQVPAAAAAARPEPPAAPAPPAPAR